MSDQHDYQGTGPKGKNRDSIQSVTKAQAAFSDGLANGWIVPDGNGGFKAGRQDSGFDAFMSKFVPLATAAGLGAAFAPALLGAAGVASTTAAGGSTLAGGATSGAITGASGAALTGGKVGKGALLGALGGGLTSGLTPYVQNATGMGNTSASALTGAGVGAVRGKLSGQGAVGGAASGLISGLAGSTAAKGIAGDLFGKTLGGAALGGVSGGLQGAISGRGAAGGAVSGAGGSLIGSGISNFMGGGSQPGSGSNPMSTDYMTNDPTNLDFGTGGYIPQYGTGYDQSGQGGGYNGSADPTGGWNPATQGIDPAFLQWAQQQQDPSGGAMSGAPGGGMGGAAGGLLGKLFGGGGLTSGAGAGGLGLLGSLLGAGASYAGSSMQNAQARQAAGQYAQNAKFNPYGISGPGGTTSFANGKGSFALNPANQKQYGNLLNLGTMADSNLMHTADTVGGYRGMNAGVVGADGRATAAGNNPLFSNVNGSGYNGLLNSMGGNAQAFNDQARGMAGGLTQDAQNRDMQSQYDMLQGRDRQANNRFMSGNLDSEFANGTLASTAGQYQTQGALDALNTRSTNNALTAQNFGIQNAQQRLANFGGVNSAAGNDASTFQNLGTNQYGQNYNNNQTGYNRASDAFGRAMGMFTGGNQNANNNAQTYSGLLGQSQNGIQNYNTFGNNSIGLGANIGSEQSGANSRAFLPQVQANGVSTNGGFLSGIGQSLNYNPYGGY